MKQNVRVQPGTVLDGLYSSLDSEQTYCPVNGRPFEPTVPNGVS